MSQFEFVFVLYSLVLGLSLVELLAGLGRTLEFKLSRPNTDRAFSIGWLTPLLALFVILDLLSFWLFAWTVQDHVAADRATVLGVVVFSSAYFLASRLVFPSDPENFTDLDTHYLRVRRVVFAMLLVMTAVQWAFLLSVPALGHLISPASLAYTGILVALMLAGAIVRGRRASLVVLVLLIARYLAIYLQ
ncbi:MAG: hypothetical protein ACKO01_02745 [Erythrobacter sp.]